MLFKVGTIEYNRSTIGVAGLPHSHTQGVSRSVFCRLGLVLGAHGALADSMLGAQHFYFTTGRPFMHLYYIIGKDREHQQTNCGLGKRNSFL